MPGALEGIRGQADASSAEWTGVQHFWGCLKSAEYRALLYCIEFAGVCLGELTFTLSPSDFKNEVPKIDVITSAVLPNVQGSYSDTLRMTAESLWTLAYVIYWFNPRFNPRFIPLILNEDCDTIHSQCRCQSTRKCVNLGGLLPARVESFSLTSHFDVLCIPSRGHIILSCCNENTELKWLVTQSCPRSKPTKC